jgi:DUF177 domain-containing protein
MKPILINNLEVAKSQEKITGEIAIDNCERLAEVVDQESGGAHKISYKLIGSVTKLHFPSLYLTINTILPVICQRCLESMMLELTLSYDYVVTETEPEEFEGRDDIDWLEMSREMNLGELIEDELLIAMPLAPVHKHECKPAKRESGEKHNPFAALKGLVK